MGLQRYASVIIVISLLVGCSSAAMQPTADLDYNTVYQAFQHGFMVRYVDENCAYAYSFVTENIIIPKEFNEPFRDYHYCAEFDTLTDAPASVPPPDGPLLPSGAFGRLWNHFGDFQEGLGFAASSEQYYTGTLPTELPLTGGAPYTLPMVPLPDGKSLWCGMRAATAGHCQTR